MKDMSRTAFAVALAGFTAVATAADVTEAELEQLKAQVASMDARMNAMDAPSLEDRFKVKGDFRYRYETIDVDGKDNRSRHRIRARLSGVVQLPTNVEIGMGLATGGDDPVSSNQTLGKGGSSKGVQWIKRTRNGKLQTLFIFRPVSIPTRCSNHKKVDCCGTATGALKVWRQAGRIATCLLLRWSAF